MIQLYHINDTVAVDFQDLESALRPATRAPARATRAALLCANGALHRGRGGARPARRPARAPAPPKARGVSLVHRVRSPSVAPGVSPNRGARGAAILRRQPAVLAAGARRAGVHR